MKTIATSFLSSDLSLVGLLYVPDGGGPFPGVLLCHPHPKYGGSMDNNVVNTLCETLADRSCVSFKFNFRGVDGSQGTFSNGIGEQEDVTSAISHMFSRQEVDSTKLGLAGYSAGSIWGFNAGCPDFRVKILAAISPPLTMFDFKSLQDCLKPKFLVCGTEDELTATEPFLQFCQKLPGPKEFRTIEGAHHSWWGYEKVMAENVANFFYQEFKKL